MEASRNPSSEGPEGLGGSEDIAIVLDDIPEENEPVSLDQAIQMIQANSSAASGLVSFIDFSFDSLGEPTLRLEMATAKILSSDGVEVGVIDNQTFSQIVAIFTNDRLDTRPIEDVCPDGEERVPVFGILTFGDNREIELNRASEDCGRRDFLKADGTDAGLFNILSIIDNQF